MKHLYFIRHGLSEMNLQGLVSGSTETPLSAEGREQARLAGKDTKALHIDFIISSPYSRALDTAKIIADVIGYPQDKIELSDLLVERDFGSMEGKPWAADFDLSTITDAETYESLEHRVHQFWEHVQTLPVDNILVSSHGSTGRMLRTVIDPTIPFKGDTPGHRFPNAKIVQLF